MPQNAKILVRRDTAANWTSVNPVLASGEWGLETDTRKLKIGDGSTAWNSLAYSSSSVSVTSPITNSGSSTSAVIGINQSALSIANTQVTGLGTASTHNTTDFDAAGSASTAQANAEAYTDAKTVTATSPITKSGTLGTGLTIGINQSAISIANTQVTGLGTASTHAATDFDSAGAAASALTSAEAYTDGKSITGTSPITATGTLGTGVTVGINQSAITIAESQVTNLTSDLAGKAPTTRTISTTAPLTGGGDLSADRTLGVNSATTSASGVVQLSDSTSTTSSTLASTPTATKAAYDLANTANTTANAAVPNTRNISTTSPLAGGGALSGDLTLSVGAGTTSVAGVVQLTDSTSSTSTTTAATPNSVATTYTLANTANTTANAATPKTTTISTTAPLAGGGDLSANRTLSLNIGSSLTTSASNLIVDSTVVPYLANANTFTKNQIINTGATTNIGLIVKGAASQTADLFEAQNSASSVLAKIDSSGNLYAPTLQSTTASTATLTTNGDTGGLLIGTVATTNKGLVVNGVASQSANLQEWQVNGTVLMRVNSAGQIQAPQPAKQALIVKAATTITNSSVTSAVGSGSATVFTYSATSQLFTVGQSVTTTGFTPTGYNATGTITAIGTVTAGTTYTFTTGNATTGTSSGTGTATVAQSANLQEWQDTTGTTLSNITPAGTLVTSGVYIGRTSALAAANSVSQSITPQAYYTTDNSAALQSRIIFLRGNSTGNVMALTSKGDTANGVAALVLTNGAFTTEVTGFGYNGNIYTNIQTATTVGLILKGAASQTADLTQWTSSTPTVLSGVNAAGQIYAGTTSSSVVGSTTLSIASVAFTSTTATYTLGSAYTTQPIVAGQTVVVAGISPAGYNGTFVVQSVGGTSGAYTFTCANATNTTVTTGTGTVALSGTFQVTAPTDYQTPTIIKRFSSTQSANMVEFQSDTGSVLSAISSGGFYNGVVRYTGTGASSFGTASVLGITLNVSSASAANTALVIGGVASQTGDLTRWADTTGTTLLRVNSAGQIQAPQPAKQGLVVKAATTITNSSVTSAVGSGSATVYTYSASSQLFTVGQSVTTTGFTPSGYNATGTITAIGTVTAGTTYTFTTGNTTTGTSSGTGTATVAQSANIQEWQDQSGTVQASINSNGYAVFGPSNATNTNIFAINGNSGASKLNVKSDGGVYFAGGIGVGFSTNQFSTPPTVGVAINTSTVIGQIIQGAASQTGDLFQTKNSAGTVLTSITSAGTINFASGNTATTATTGAITAPSQVAGYITAQIAGTTVKIPYYNN